METPAFAELLAALDADAAAPAAQLATDLVVRYLAESHRGEGAPTSLSSPEAVAGRFEAKLPTGGRPFSEVLERIARDVLPDVTRLGHPLCMGHQVSSPLPAAIWTSTLVTALNQSHAVREMSPAGTVIEHRLIAGFAMEVGWGEAAGGTLTSGGTEATFTALLAARAALLPDAWERGLVEPLPVVVCGEHAHYSVSRAVGAMGLGTKRVRPVPSRDHAMDPEALEKTLDAVAKEGAPVMAVVATAGCTATGSFDDLERIGALCERRGLWLHVDGAHGASALLSQTHRAKLKGVASARSLAWDPHKMLSLPLASGLLLVREGRDLDAAYAQAAPYLFHAPGAGTRSWDLGKRSFQCSRRGDALTLWATLQRYGTRGLGAHYDQLCESASVLHRMLAESADFEPLHRPQCNILCFRHRPEGVEASQLDGHQERLRARHHAAGRGFLTLTTLDGQRTLRVTLMNPRSERRHLEALVEGLRHSAREVARGEVS